MNDFKFNFIYSEKFKFNAISKISSVDLNNFDLIKAINPKRRLFFEFNEDADQASLAELKSTYNFEVNNNILTAELPESDLKSLLLRLLDKFSPISMSFEDLPVEETMRSFFINPDQYLNND